MSDLHSILATHPAKLKDEMKSSHGPVHPQAETSEIPDLFFDEILVYYKLNRVEIMVMMFLYRQVWCRPNLYKEYGFSQILSHTEIAKCLNVTIDDVYHAIRKLEDFSFIETIRSGQYFVRKYFTKENDLHFGQLYDSF